jgi:flagellar protein FliL
MSTSTKEKAAETAEAPKKGKKKLLLIVLVLLLAAGGAAYFFLFSGSANADEKPVSSGTFLTLEPVAVNLAGGGYLKVGVALELTENGAAGGHGGEGLDGSKAKDLIISTFSQAAPADVTGARDALKAALQQKIIEAYTEDGHELVMGIYYTDYVTQ